MEIAETIHCHLYRCYAIRGSLCGHVVVLACISLPDHFEDHWVVEYWNVEQSRWILLVSQLDELQQNTLKIEFDVLDVPRDQYIVGGKAWQMCRLANKTLRSLASSICTNLVLCEAILSVTWHRSINMT